MAPSAVHHDAAAAALSRDIYLDRIPFEMACVRMGLTPIEIFDHAGTQAALARSSDAAWLVFRGTEATRLRIVDIAANILLRPQLWSGNGLVHTGYAAALERVRDDARALAETVPSEVPLYVTGHSLGGALATLYAAWVTTDRKRGHRINALVTFGAPKAATRAALEPIGWHSRIRRYVMPLDPAPLWPPLMFAHPGRAILLEPQCPWWRPIRRHDVSGYAAALAPA